MPLHSHRRGRFYAVGRYGGSARFRDHRGGARLFRTEGGDRAGGRGGYSGRHRQVLRRSGKADARFGNRIHAGWRGSGTSSRYGQRGSGDPAGERHEPPTGGSCPAATPFEPFEKEFRIRYRVDGVLFNQEQPPREMKAAIVSRLKLMAKLNIAERRLPQDGRIKIKTMGREVDLRVSTLPTLYGESVVMRLLDRSAGDFYDLRRLGFDDKMLSRMEHYTSLPHGIFLVTGPTGSGKSTTLSSALKSINQSDKKIITIEDPGEYQMDGINQTHVNPQIGLTFASGLRHIVRQDPDMLMVGEIRDRETADIAIRAALTGHFVYSTLHTNDAPSAITRLTDMGVENYLITSSVT